MERRGNNYVDCQITPAGAPWHSPCLASCICIQAQNPQNGDWPNYGNDPGGMRYSTLTQINRETVAKLKVAWAFHTGDIADGNDGYKRSGFETTPILVDGTLFLTTPFNRVIALDPATGTQRWAYDPNIDRSLDYGDGLINRGVATWLDSSKSPDATMPTQNIRSNPRCPADRPRCGDRQTLHRLRRSWPSQSSQCSGIRDSTVSASIIKAGTT